MNKNMDTDISNVQPETNEKEKINHNILLCPKYLCTACFACQAVCPRDAISKSKDDYGVSFPVIDNKKCIKCKRCKEICPQINKLDLHLPSSCFAAQAKNRIEMERSSSGAIGALLAKAFLDDGGVVYGCSVVEGITKHIVVNNTSESDGLRGSKYVQSDMEGIIIGIIEKLRQGRKILFFGTPCQVAGVVSATKGMDDQLFCVDIICHGVPPQQYLDDHLRNIIGNKKYDSYSFRGGKDDFSLKVIYKGEKIYCKSKIRDKYFFAFLRGLCYRENCYSCFYAREKRLGDLTIGDFWGINRNTMKTIQDGKISLVLLNSNKGLYLWNKIKKDTTWEDRELNEAIEGNDQLRTPCQMPIERQKFIEEYKSLHDFDKAFNKSGVRKEWILGQIKQWNPISLSKKALKKCLKI